MDARKCDRCGKYYDLYNTNFDKPNEIKLSSADKSGRYSIIKNLDLCPDCMKALKKFMEGKQC